MIHCKIIFKNKKRKKYNKVKSLKTIFKIKERKNKNKIRIYQHISTK